MIKATSPSIYAFTGDMAAGIPGTLTISKDGVALITAKKAGFSAIGDWTDGVRYSTIQKMFDEDLGFSFMDSINYSQPYTPLLDQFGEVGPKLVVFLVPAGYTIVPSDPTALKAQYQLDVGAPVPTQMLVTMDGNNLAETIALGGLDLVVCFSDDIPYQYEGVDTQVWDTARCETVAQVIAAITARYGAPQGQAEGYPVWLTSAAFAGLGLQYNIFRIPKTFMPGLPVTFTQADGAQTGRFWLNVTRLPTTLVPLAADVVATPAPAASNGGMIAGAILGFVAGKASS